MVIELFEFIENLFTKRQPVDSKTVFKEQYMVTKFLSLYPGTFTVAGLANRLSCKIPGWATNMFLFHTIKKQRAPHFQYPKGAEKEKKYPPEALQKICGKFCCSTEHAIQIIKILEKKDPQILESLGISPEGEKKSASKKNRKLPQPRGKA
jgi:hypothetical protein